MQPLGENSSNVPAFLGKLWKMVNDPNTDHLICWSPAGNSFVIQNQAQFWYELLPLYYKHNNMSSFVRQLNMYGFHKMSSVENGTMDSDKDEIQFYHRFFQKDQPELLRNIKRKVTTTKTEQTVQNQNPVKNDDIANVLTEVKNLHGRQSSVDSQLSAMKQENAVLWRELAMLRQKHIKQQQIVNKLIQFLVTLVQPSASSRIGVGVKRRMPLMLNESPNKKGKVKKSVKKEVKNDNVDQTDNGPTIHELDSEIEISPEELFEEDIEEDGLVSSPQASSSSPSDITQSNSVSSSEENLAGDLPENYWDKPEFVSNNANTNNDKEVFLNPSTQDTLLSNLVNGSYNSLALKGKNGKKVDKGAKENSDSSLNQDGGPDMTVATRDLKINNGTLSTNECCRDDLDLHLDSTQSEIDQLKDILHGCNTLDANALLGLFTDDAPAFGLSSNKNNPATGDPMVSGTELATCDNDLIDFNELFDDSLDGEDTPIDILEHELDSTINTPMVIKSEPIFPKLAKEL